MIHFTLLNARATHEMLGMIPEFLNPTDLSSAREQLDRAYRHGGGAGVQEVRPAPREA